MLKENTSLTSLNLSSEKEFLKEKNKENETV